MLYIINNYFYESLQSWHLKMRKQNSIQMVYNLVLSQLFSFEWKNTITQFMYAINSLNGIFFLKQSNFISLIACLWRSVIKTVKFWTKIIIANWMKMIHTWFSCGQWNWVIPITPGDTICYLNDCIKAEKWFLIKFGTFPNAIQCDIWT